MGWILILIAAAVFGIGSTYFWKPDNPIEEVAEVIIEKELDLPVGSVDLTPKDWINDKKK